MFLQDYEIMIIFSPVLSQQDYSKKKKEYSKSLQKDKGKVIHINSWGLKSLAYPIQKKTTGLYSVMEFQCNPSIIDFLNTKLRRDETVLRYMITKLDKSAVEYNHKRRSEIEEKEENILEKDTN